MQCVILIKFKFRIVYCLWLHIGNTAYHGQPFRKYWGRDKTAQILQIELSNELSQRKIFEFQLKFLLSVFLRVELTINSGNDLVQVWMCTKMHINTSVALVYWYIYRYVSPSLVKCMVFDVFHISFFSFCFFSFAWVLWCSMNACAQVLFFRKVFFSFDINVFAIYHMAYFMRMGYP